MGLPKVSSKISNAVLDTGAVQNLIVKEAVLQYCTKEIKITKPRWLLSFAETPSQLRENIMLHGKLGQRVFNTGHLDGRSLDVDVLLGTEFTDNNVMSIQPNPGVLIAVGSSPIYLRGTYMNAKI